MELVRIRKGEVDEYFNPAHVVRIEPHFNADLRQWSGWSVVVFVGGDTMRVPLPPNVIAEAMALDGIVTP